MKAEKMFSGFVTAYLFLGGAGAGSLIVLSFIELLDTLQQVTKKRLLPLWPINLLRELFRRCWPICLIVLMVASLCLFVDLGRPDRVLMLFLAPRFSAITIGSFSLILSILCALVFSVFRTFDSVSLPNSYSLVFCISGIAAGITTALYTGILLNELVSVLFWNSFFIPLLFFLSSLSMGIACVLSGGALVVSRRSAYRAFKRLCRFDGALIILEMLCLGAWLIFALIAPTTKDTVQVFLSGELSWIFWLGLIFCGMVIPLFLEFRITENNHSSQMLWIAFLIIVGGFVLRYCIVEAAAYDITQILFVLPHF